MKKYIKKIVTAACIYYTAATFLILFLYWALNSDLSRGVQPRSLIFILPFAICFATANVIFGHAPIGPGMRVLLHFLLTVGGAWIFLYLPGRDPAAAGSQGLILFLALTILYAIIMGAVLVFKARIKRVQRDESEYNGVYKNK